MNRVVLQRDGEPGDVSYTYDGIGNLKTVRQGTNVPWTYVYDDANRRVKEIDPLGAIVEYGYDDSDRTTWAGIGAGGTWL